METIIFVAFVALEITFHATPHLIHKWPKLADRVAHMAIVQHISNHHYAVWIFHPAIWQGVQGYIVHLVVYSGKVIAHN